MHGALIAGWRARTGVGDRQCVGAVVAGREARISRIEVVRVPDRDDPGARPLELDDLTNGVRHLGHRRSGSTRGCRPDVAPSAVVRPGHAQDRGGACDRVEHVPVEPHLAARCVRDLRQQVCVRRRRVGVAQLRGRRARCLHLDRLHQRPPGRWVSGGERRCHSGRVDQRPLRITARALRQQRPITRGRSLHRRPNIRARGAEMPVVVAATIGVDNLDRVHLRLPREQVVIDQIRRSRRLRLTRRQHHSRAEAAITRARRIVRRRRARRRRTRRNRLRRSRVPRQRHTHRARRRRKRRPRHRQQHVPRDHAHRQRTNRHRRPRRIITKHPLIPTRREPIPAHRRPTLRRRNQHRCADPQPYR